MGFLCLVLYTTITSTVQAAICQANASYLTRYTSECVSQFWLHLAKNLYFHGFVCFSCIICLITVLFVFHRFWQKRELCTINMTGIFTFHKMIGYMLRLDCSIKDDNGEPAISSLKSDGAGKFSFTNLCLLSHTGFMILSTIFLWSLHSNFAHWV